VLREDLSEKEIMEFVADKVAPHKRIRAVEFVDRIPKSPSGKILRRVLVAYEREGAPLG
jgi:acyl-coenzyme A synthetase/AMP-(fatty) acid ligase